MIIMKRTCPKCEGEVTYKNRISFYKAKKLNRPCIKCTRKEVSNRPEERIKNSERQKGKRMGIENHFFNKKHTELTIQKLRDNAKVLSGKENYMYNRSFYDVWVSKYGKDEADIRMVEFKKKQSINNSGEKNNMFGKPSPNGSGNGWSGWYKKWYFRSLMELSYMINIIERFSLNWEAGENIKIPYIDINGNIRNYLPDFIINGKYIIECKPRKLINSKTILIKTEAAKAYCFNNNLIYKILEPHKLTTDEIKYLYINNQLIFTKRYDSKVRSLLKL